MGDSCQLATSCRAVDLTIDSSVFLDVSSSSLYFMRKDSKCSLVSLSSFEVAWSLWSRLSDSINVCRSRPTGKRVSSECKASITRLRTGEILLDRLIRSRLKPKRQMGELLKLVGLDNLEHRVAIR